MAALSLFASCASRAAPQGSTAPQPGQPETDGQSASEKTGAYTIAQAAQGERIFNQGEGCVRCHSVQEFTGRIFEIRWAARTVADLHLYILSQMPLDSPGSLAPRDAWALTAYVLRMNGYPPGDLPLGSDLARAQRMPLVEFHPPDRR